MNCETSCGAWWFREVGLPLRQHWLLIGSSLAPHGLLFDTGQRSTDDLRTFEAKAYTSYTRPTQHTSEPKTLKHDPVMRGFFEA